jgi:hypothetical protein
MHLAHGAQDHTDNERGFKSLAQGENVGREQEAPRKIEFRTMNVQLQSILTPLFRIGGADIRVLGESLDDMRRQAANVT